MEPTNNNKKKIILLVLLGILLLALGGLFVWYFGSKGSNKSEESKVTNVSTEAAKPTETAKTAPPSAQSTPVVSDETLIKAALVAKTGIAADKIDVTLSTKTDKLAKGLVSAKGEEFGGGYFLAAKVNSDWVIVFDGQSTPDCASVNPYNFPASMVPECVDSSGNIVTR